MPGWAAEGYDNPGHDIDWVINDFVGYRVADHWSYDYGNPLRDYFMLPTHEFEELWDMDSKDFIQKWKNGEIGQEGGKWGYYERQSQTHSYMGTDGKRYEVVNMTVHDKFIEINEREPTWWFLGIGGGRGDNDVGFNEAKDGDTIFSYDGSEISASFGSIAKDFGRLLKNMNIWRTNERIKVVDLNPLERLNNGWKSSKSALEAFYPDGFWFHVPAFGDSIQFNPQTDGLPLYRHIRDTSVIFDSDSADFYLNTK